MTEREAIVAWLRKEAGEFQAGADNERNPLHMRYWADITAFTQRKAADAIEAGQHLEKQDG